VPPQTPFLSITLKALGRRVVFCLGVEVEWHSLALMFYQRMFFAL